MTKNEKKVPDPAQAHATFLRAVLALDSSDPNLPRFVPPRSEDPDATAKQAPGSTDQATESRRRFPRVPPPRRSR